ncbi:MAG TPA: hypothetical protein DCM08_11310 [Microscillaceae bacterium]|jgi:predicted alpha/beta hydrolase|nr:hypothetical protein [Microscillaceae bacterium]
MQKIQVTTSDNYPLSATWFEPTQANAKVLLISSALGLKQQFYADFAQFFADYGYHVYTYDYRGIGESKPAEGIRSMRTVLSDWGTLDFPAMAAYIQAQHPNQKYYLIGNSFGGNCLGMSEASSLFTAFVTVGAQHGYWRLFWKNKQPLLFVFWYLLIPILSRVYGYFPSRLVGIGEDLPKGVALEWGKFCRHPQWVFAFLPEHKNYYPTLAKPILAISLADDYQAPQRAVDKLHTEGYQKAQVERLHLHPSEIGAKSIGHFGFFRKKFKESLWPLALQWFEKH